jgi:hypothetical protein
MMDGDWGWVCDYLDFLPIIDGGRHSLFFVLCVCHLVCGVTPVRSCVGGVGVSIENGSSIIVTV